MAKKKIALFGGAFDPPHLGHSQVAKSLLKQKAVQEVWFVPVFTHPWAKKLHKEFLTKYDMRVSMLETVVADLNESFAQTQDLSCVRVAHFRDVSFTYDTLMFFSKEFPEYEFSWVMGSEYLPKFDAFLEMHPRLMDFPFFIYPRKGFGFEQLYPNMMPLKNMPEIEISSTMVRKAVRTHETIHSLVIDQVKEKIEKWNLYTASKKPKNN